MDGSWWEVAGIRYRRNPRRRVTGDDLAMVRLWGLYRGGGFGPGHLPDAGGAGDQPAIMLDAFAIMSAVAADYEKKDGQKGR